MPERKRQLLIRSARPGRPPAGRIDGMTATLTPRERVLGFLHRAPIDRIPVDYCANPGIDRRLKAHVGLAEHDDEGLRRALGVDFRGLGAAYTGPRLHPEQTGVQVDACFGIHTRWVEHATGGYQDFCDFPLATAARDAVAAWPFPDPDRFDYAGLAAQAAAWRGFGVHLGNAGTGDVLNFSGALMGMARVYAALAEDDPAWHLLAERKIDCEVAVLERSLAACRGAVSFLWMGEDLGSQRGPLCSLATYRRIIAPLHRRILDLARSHDLPVMIHSCGSSRFAFADFAAMGIAAIDVLQPDAAGMDAVEIKAAFGDRLAFHGGIGTGGVVAHGTPAQAGAEAERVIRAYMPGGGYAFSPAHALQDDTPVANVLAIYDAARRVGAYA
jgi:uroporphyrinogen decarboxylase